VDHGPNTKNCCSISTGTARQSIIQVVLVTTSDEFSPGKHNALDAFLKRTPPEQSGVRDVAHVSVDQVIVGIHPDNERNPVQARQKKTQQAEVIRVAGANDRDFLAPYQ
jgi:hypothetical protein